MKGKVYLVGAGPGEKELITVKGKKLLEECGAVVYDSLASEQLLDYVGEDCERIFVGKRSGFHSMEQEKINAILVEKALEGKTVVRLKGGDPFVFGRGGEEIEALKRAELFYEVIPGVTSAIAVPACAGIPVTHRGMSQSVHIVTGHTASFENQLTDNYEALAKAGGTLVFLMGLSNLSKIASELMKYGKPGNTPAAVISFGTTERQRVLRSTLSAIAEEAKKEQMKAPAVIVIGETAALQCQYQKMGRLYGISVGVTGSSHFTQKLTKLLKEEGAFVRLLAQMRLKEINQEKFTKELLKLEAYHWVVFTSSNAVSLFFLRLKKLGCDFRRLSHIKFAVIGEGTEQTLLQYGFQADFMPSVYTSSALLAGLLKVIEPGERVLLPRAAAGSEELSQGFEKAGIIFTELPVYALILRQEGKEILEGELKLTNYVIFGSSSGVRALFEQEGLTELLGNQKLVAIGEITAEALKSFGYRNPIVAKKYTAEGIVSAICLDVVSRAGASKEKEGDS